MSLGVDLKGVVPFHPDTRHYPSLAAGMVKRVAAQMPVIDPLELRNFRRFVKKFMHNRLQSLVFDPEETFELEEWLDNNDSYNEARKQQLRECNEYYKDKKPKMTVNMFCKKEFYPEPKHLRAILARHDSYKCKVGPFFKKFGDKLFNLEWFIKKVPVDERPKKLYERFKDCAEIFDTDFSQYEATFVRELLLIERMVYAFSLKNHPLRAQIMAWIDKLIAENIIKCPGFIAGLFGKRMSGEMNTSCGNGLMNMLITFYVLRKAGNSWAQIKAYFEGDDGQGGCAYLPKEEDYRKLGCNIKIKIPESINTASFCGNVFDPIVLHNLTNPLEASAKFGWTDNKYCNASDKTWKKLLRCKSFSMVYEYRGCPILRELALYGLRVTSDVKLDLNFVKKNSNSVYKLEEIVDMYNSNGESFELRSDVINCKVEMASRLIVQNLWGITIEQQILAEEYLKNLNIIQQLDLSDFLNYPDLWKWNYNTYVREVPYYNKNLFFQKRGFETIFYMDANTRVSWYH